MTHSVGSAVSVFTAFGSKWHGDLVFEDKTPIKPDELFQPKAMKVMQAWLIVEQKTIVDQ
ncbi:MAG: hypothetical protein M3299_13030 [Thermoproteota archaeon]|nr:hypothetical protein [Thermoproteota archaeon]